jgi:hypothetical protein
MAWPTVLIAPEQVQLLPWSVDSATWMFLSLLTA